MDYEGRQALIHRIVCGFTPSQLGGDIILIYDPRPKDHLIVEGYYKEAYDRLIKQGVPTQDDINALLLEKGIWSEKDEDELKVLQDNLKKMKMDWQATEFRSNERKNIEVYLSHTKDGIKKLLKRKDSLNNTTAEYLARLEKFRRILFFLTKHIDGSRVWTNWEEFTRTEDRVINDLITKSYFNEVMIEATVRELARSEPWRSTWISAVKVGDLFEHAVSQMTDYQKALVTWSIIYDSAYESSEPPSSAVVDDDGLFDMWLEEQSAKREADRDKSVANNIISKSSKIGSAAEVGIMVDSPEDAERVYKLNSALARTTLRKRENIIQESSTGVSEGKMPDTKQKLMMELNKLATAKHRN